MITTGLVTWFRRRARRNPGEITSRSGGRTYTVLPSLFVTSNRWCYDHLPPRPPLLVFWLADYDRDQVAVPVTALGLGWFCLATAIRVLQNIEHTLLLAAVWGVGAKSGTEGRMMSWRFVGGPEEYPFRPRFIWSGLLDVRVLRGRL